MSSSTESSAESANRALLKDALNGLDFSGRIDETATALYTRVYEDDLYHGRTVETVVAGTIYVASRIEGHACNPTTVAAELNVSRKALLSTARHLIQHLDGITPQPIEPDPYVVRYTDTLELDESIQQTALSIVESCKQQGRMHSGKSPTGFAAGAVYAASELDGGGVTQKDVSEVADVSTVTIRNQYRSQIEEYQRSLDADADE